MNRFNNKEIKFLDTPLNELSYVVFDLETTGTQPEYGDKIIEIGAVQINPGFRIVNSKFHTLVNPFVEIPKSSTEIHGITNEKVNSAPDVCTAIYDFIDFAKGSVLVAHDAGKDFSFLKSEMRDYRISNPFKFLLDTLRLSRIVNPASKAHSLDYITDSYNIRINGPYKRHRALYDAEVTAVFFRILMHRIFENFCFTLIELENFIDKK